VRYTYTSTAESAIRKLEYDLFYLKNMSPILDCIIVAQTIRIVSTGQGAV
jgi:lipopolysaccharide/colanic/teichoic acid biosynthesis glycosyltransferase